MALRKGQKELVEQYRGGYCAVPAIPGGGKTHCLTMWAVEMISRGLHKPGKILIVTYMNSAVNNFKQRISKELENRGINGSKEYHVSTIHGLCLQIIKENPDQANINDEFDIIDGAGKQYIISSAVDEWRKNYENVFKYYLDEKSVSTGRYEKTANDWHERLCTVISAAIGDFKCRGINPEEAKKLCAALPANSLLKHAAAIYDTYDRRLKASGMVDFDDMLHKAGKLLKEDADLLEKYRRKYTFVCEDEAQDSNLLQNEILELIANGNFLRVGDSNQAICSTFTSSDFKYFKEFCSRPQTVVYNITQSSRSTVDIINLANYFVDYVTGSHPVEECRTSLLTQHIEPVREDDERRNPVTDEYAIRTAVFNSWEEEAAGVARYARHMLKNYPEKSVAILVPTSWKIKDIVSLLEANGVTYEELDGGSYIKTRALRLLGRALNFHSSPDDSEKFADLVNDLLLSDEPIKKTQLVEYISECSPEDILYPEAGKANLENVPEELRTSKVWSSFSTMLDFFRDLLELPPVSVEGLILAIAEKLDFDREEKAIAQRVAGDIKFMRLRNPRWQMNELAEELLSSRSMYSYFAGLVWDLKGYEPKPGVVTLATYHKSKGLEWDVVFMSGLSFADFPVNLGDKFAGEYWFLKQEFKNPQALVKSEFEALTGGGSTRDATLKAKLETISERARLLYVGITRAKQYLFLSGFHSNMGKRNEVQPSAYLLELKRYIDRNSTKGSDSLADGTKVQVAGPVEVIEY